MMAGSREQYESDLLSLPVEERARLAKLLISSLDELDDPAENEDIDEYWLAESDRRYREIIDGQVEIIPAAEAMTAARAALKR